MNRQAEPVEKPKFVRFFPSRQNKDSKLTLNAHMFAEDIARLMPYRVRDGRKVLQVKFHGSVADRDHALRVLQALSEHSHGNHADIVCRVVDDIARHISWEGRAQFELLPCEDGSIFFHRVTSVNMLQIFGLVIQFVPAKDRKFWGGNRFRFARKSALWHVDIPDSLGGRRRYIKTLRRLECFDNLGPIFFQKDITSALTETRFDQRRYIQMNNIFKSIETHRWGWNYRDWSTESRTEFFNFYRRLSAEKAKSLFREHILSELNKLLKRLQISCTISVEGLLTVPDIEQLKRDLVDGEIGFSSLLDRVSNA